MLVNVEQKILQLDGKPFDDGGDFRKVVTMALGNTMPGVVPGDERLDGETKLKWFQIALKVQNANPDVELTVDEAKVIKDRVGLTHGPLVVGRVVEMIEGARSSAPEIAAQ